VRVGEERQVKSAIREATMVHSENLVCFLKKIPTQCKYKRYLNTTRALKPLKNLLKSRQQYLFFMNAYYCILLDTFIRNLKGDCKEKVQFFIV